MLAGSIDKMGLAAVSKLLGDWPDTLEISGLSVDSRLTKPGHLFCAMPGLNMHGAEFISFALRMGAVMVLTDKTGVEIAQKELGTLKVPFLVSDDPRAALSIAAAHWYGAQPENIVAITGTNGKTSIANFTRQILENLGCRAVNFGTTGVEGAITAPLAHTTPEPIALHALLKDFSEQGITHACMEASSHGLEQRRLDGVDLKAAAFTNITRDHMDYHDSFGDYFAAKAGLFDRVLAAGKTAVLNLDDPFGDTIRLVAQGRKQNILSVGGADGCDLQILNTRFDDGGQELRFSWQDAIFSTRLKLIGGFQASNALMAAGLAIACGEKPEAVFAVLEELETVRGRMELAATRKNGAQVFVDYSHTPDSLKTALTALRPHVMGRLLVVFGAGGDRDKGKRPLMGKAASYFADLVFVTDDNPRSENPADIRAEVMAGCPDAIEIGDRAEAILRAVDALQPGDTLLIAGKGHETGQVVGDDILPFDDVEQASISVQALEMGV